MLLLFCFEATPNTYDYFKKEKGFPLHISVLFLTSIAFGVEFLSDTHLQQFCKILNLRQDLMNGELKYCMTAI